MVCGEKMKNYETLKNKKILITGAWGFVGKNLVNYLENVLNIPSGQIYKPVKSFTDFTNQQNVENTIEFIKPNVIIHLAGNVGGIGKNIQIPGKMFYDNALMGILVMEYARKYGVQKMICLAAGCGYPENLVPPLKESDFFNGLPDESSLGYSMAKKNLIIQSWTYRKQYNFDSTVLLPANLYGPHDYFSDTHNNHVVPALVKKFVDAKEKNLPEVEVWGTGNATREFLYVDDCVKAIVDAIFVNNSGPFNLGTGVETSILQLTSKLKTLTGYQGEVKFNNLKPDGQKRRFYDMSLFKDVFGYTPETSLEDGLLKTIEYYKSLKV